MSDAGTMPARRARDVHVLRARSTQEVVLGEHRKMAQDASSGDVKSLVAHCYQPVGANEMRDPQHRRRGAFRLEHCVAI